MTKPRRTGRRRLFVGVLGALAACGSPTSVEPVTTSFEWVSERGEWVGSGTEGRVTLADGSWIARFSPIVASRTQERVEVSAPGWSMLFAVPDGETFRVGTYRNAQRSLDRAQPVLDVGGNGRGCNVTSGEFEVLFVEPGEGNELNALRLRFTQYCEGDPEALRGDLSILANPWR